jgi:hypothetical protein
MAVSREKKAQREALYKALQEKKTLIDELEAIGNSAFHGPEHTCFIRLEPETADRYRVSFSDVTEAEARAIVEAVRVRLAAKVED